MGDYTIPVVIAAMSGAAVLGTRAVPKGENQVSVWAGRGASQCRATHADIEHGWQPLPDSDSNDALLLHAHVGNHRHGSTLA